MATLKSVGPGSAMKIGGFLYAVLGLFMGTIFSAVAAMGAFAGGGREFGPFAALFGVGAIILFPIMYGVIGAIAAAIGALLYNLCAKVMGGLEIEVQ